MARILYFAYLVDTLGTASEEVALPESVTDVRGLLAWLRGRGGSWETALADDKVTVTVNRQFASLDTPIANNHEIAIVSAQPW